MDTSIWRPILYLIGVMAFAGVNAAWLGWCERKGAGHIQRRIGPKEVGPFGLLQPLADGIKLMTKQLLVPQGVDGILFRVAPVLAMIPAITSMVAIPFSATVHARPIELSVLLIFALASIGMMAILLGGWASNNKYSLISAARSVSQNVAYEIPMLVTVITIVMLSGSMNLEEIALQQQGGFWNWYIFPIAGQSIAQAVIMPISFLIFFTCSVAETNRAPFDMAEAESELVAGHMTEYGSMGFGLFMMGEYLNIVVGACLTAVLFFGGWDSPLPFIPSGVLWFVLKIYLLIFIFIWIRWTYPRTQIYKLLNLSWKILIPFSLAILLLTAVFIKIEGILI
ncbi:MAG: NADH-quinone oxidoreductase subunit NuoH [Desulfobulbaceae bacterium]|jgi:NADH-quinone oxidoreductase subunit H|nr:NADH-quinone oxidoreductase subunit NuoH [Desulfobulbaceae bacterium]MDY0350228.1 NADH-quinone oxidoreductase subunit NuoH [Desulfobulbaceae bacterium]